MKRLKDDEIEAVFENNPRIELALEEVGWCEEFWRNGEGEYDCRIYKPARCFGILFFVRGRWEESGNSLCEVIEWEINWGYIDGNQVFEVGWILFESDMLLVLKALASSFRRGEISDDS